MMCHTLLIISGRLPSMRENSYNVIIEYLCVGTCVRNGMVKLQMQELNRETRLRKVFFRYLFSYNGLSLMLKHVNTTRMLNWE